MFGVWDDTMLVRDDPLLDASADLVGEIQRRLTAQGSLVTDPVGEYGAATRAGLADWAGWANLEMRLRDDDLISWHLVRELRDVTPEVEPGTGRD